MFDKNVHCIIQSRNGSNRLPNKAIKKINGHSILEILLKRVKKAKYLNSVIVATTMNKKDDSIVRICKKNSTNYFRGSEKNVLKRITDCAKQFNSNIIVYLTADNFLIDPLIIDWMIKKYLTLNSKFITNSGFLKVSSNQIPLGMHVSVFDYKNLSLINKKFLNKEFREHPTLYFYTQGKKYFKPKNILSPKKWTRSYYPRLTLDTKEDLLFLSKIFTFFIKKNKIDKFNFGLVEILKFLDNNLNLLTINKNISHHIPRALKYE